MKITVCQILWILFLDFGTSYAQDFNHLQSSSKDNSGTNIKLFTFHGNVSYDFFYRSSLDTPINEQNLQQQAERVMLTISVKERYPIIVLFSGRESNSPYFKNFYDPNIQFDWNTYERNLKQELIAKLQKKYLNSTSLKSTEVSIQQQRNKYNKLKSWLESPTTEQKLIQEKEQKLIVEKENIHVLPAQNDSSDKNRLQSSEHPFQDELERKKTELKSEELKLEVLQIKERKISDSIQKGISGIRQQIYGAVNTKELKKIASDNELVLSQGGKFEKYLTAVKKFSLGKTILNYTELTAQNILLSGVNIEYNPSYYIAFAAGKVDYQFRDFYNRPSVNPNQNLVLGRVGFGDLNRKAFIISYYQGRKNITEYAFLGANTSQVDLMGYSLEGIFKKDVNNNISIELAKSTKPLTYPLPNKETGALWKLSDESNMGVNIKAQMFIKTIQTRLSGYFRKTGENFQSFSQFTFNTNQTAWQAKVVQDFMKRKISLTGMLRQDDFVNPFVDQTFKTSTIFKTFQLNMHFPKYPSVSLGYYPATQIFVVNQNLARENAYYLLNSSVVYSYFFNHINMNSSFVLNRYYNKGTDSGFITYKGISYYFSQSAFLKKIQLQGTYSYTSQEGLKYSIVETGINYPITKNLKVDISSKYNKVKEGNSYWGQRVEMDADFKRVGTIRIQYDKSYLPTINQNLYSMETARISLFKSF